MIWLELIIAIYCVVIVVACIVFDRRSKAISAQDRNVEAVTFKAVKDWRAEVELQKAHGDVKTLQQDQRLEVILANADTDVLKRDLMSKEQKIIRLESYRSNIGA